MTKSVKAYFEAHAETFDSIYLNESRFSRWLNTIFRKAVYERFHIAITESGNITGKTILDIGCGSGRYMVEYAKQGADKVTGIDFSAPMLDLARKLVIQQGVEERCEFVQGDFLEHDFTHKFDVVLAMGVFDYVENPQAFLQKLTVCSRGIVIAGFPGKSLLRMPLRRLRYRMRNCPIYFYSADEINRLANAVGLKDYKLVFIPQSGTGYVLVGKTA